MKVQRYLTIFVLVLLFGAIGSSQNHAGAEVGRLQTGTTEVTLEDFDDILTLLDLGFNDFSGNMGAINDQYLPLSTLNCATDTDCALRLDWDFGGGGEIFTGYFYSLFGLTDTLTTFDGTTIETLEFPEHTLDMDDIDGDLADSAGTRQFNELCFTLTYDTVDTVQFRLELNDTAGGTRYTRKTITGSPNPQTICWDFRNDYIPGGMDVDLNATKLFTMIIEQQNIGAGINNPLTGRFDIDRIWFEMAQTDAEPADDQALLDLMELRAFQYFLDWSSRKPESLDIPQDRSTFGDLLTVGGIGFGIPAHIIGAERGWTTRAESAERVLNILEVLDDDTAFGPERIGRIGHHGWFYHFLGVDGRRKLNFDFPATPGTDESLNTVELSSIDTGLAVIGVLAAQSYFDHPTNPTEVEIRNRAQSVYDRVEWDFLYESNLDQFYLGWKPTEMYEGPPFEIPDGEGNGGFSGEPGSPATLDYYTDEALILLILGIGSDTHPIPPEAYYNLFLHWDDAGLVRTFPGALFTYQFYHAFLEPEDCSPFWYDNSRQAIQTVIEYATQNPGGFATYGPNAWGISANEGPFDEYGANGSPWISVNTNPEEDGSVTYYAMMSVAGYGPDMRPAVVDALRAGWDRNHWHPRFSLPDAFHDEVSEITPFGGVLRQSGPWNNRALFAIDQGPMLLHLENAYSGLIWQLLSENQNIQRAFNRIPYRVPAHLILEAEDGTGQGTIMPRSNAWGMETVWLHAGESRVMSYSSEAAENVQYSVRYSNDNTGMSENVHLFLDGIILGFFTAEDTGDNGNGWNNFVISPQLSVGSLAAGEHFATVTISDGDGFGIEIDAAIIDFYKQAGPYCTLIPASFKN